MKYSVSTVHNYQAYTLLTLRPTESDGLWFTPGQYVTISADGLLATPTRCFSIVSSPNETELQIAFRVGGKVTTEVSRLRIGDSVSIQGPFGDFVLEETSRPLVLIASGIGVTPFISMLRYLVQQGSTRPITILTTNRTVASIPFREEIEALTEQLPNAQLAFFVGDSGEGVISGQISARTLRAVADSADPNTLYYVCGPAQFDGRIQQSLREIGVPERNIRSEAFSQSTSTPARYSLIRRVVYGSAFGFAALAALITGVDMLATHEKAEAAYAAAHPSVRSNESESSNAGADTNSSDSSSNYSQVPQSYSVPTSTYYSPPSSSAS